MIIYKITNKINGKIYIGQTINTVDTRFSQHCRQKSSVLSKAINKYGKTNFIIEVLEIVQTRDELDYLERYYIKYYNSISPFGYNLEGGGSLKKEISLETRKKQSLSHLGKSAPWNSYKRSPETLRKMSECNLGRPGYWTGKKRPLTNSKPVLCLTNDTIYASARLVSKYTGVGFPKISLICNGLRKQSKGFTFMFLGEL